jgi:hypothetical protein
VRGGVTHAATWGAGDLKEGEGDQAGVVCVCVWGGVPAAAGSRWHWLLGALPASRRGSWGMKAVRQADCCK